MGKAMTSALGLGLVGGLVGLAAYFFAFGQTFEGPVSITPADSDPDVVATVHFESRFKNRRFLTHSVYLNLETDTPCTYLGEEIGAAQLVGNVGGEEVEARVGYRESRPGWGSVASLDIEPPGSSPKETLLVVSLLLIFGCTGGMAVVAKMGD